MAVSLEGLQCPMCQRSELEVLDGWVQCPECNWSMRTEVAHRGLRDKEIVALVQEGRTTLLDGFTSRAGKKFSAMLTLTDDGGVKFEFPERPHFDETPISQCPLCGGDVVEGPKSYSCSNWRREANKCEFTIWKDAAGHSVTREEATKLVAGETLGPFAMRSRAGKRFRAKLHLDAEAGKVQFEFLDDGRHGTHGGHDEDDESA